MAPEKDVKKEEVPAKDKPAKKRATAGTRKKKSEPTSAVKKTPKKTKLPVRVVSKKDGRKDSHEEDIVAAREDAVKLDSVGEDREFFKKTSKKTAKEEKEKVKIKEVSSKKEEKKEDKKEKDADNDKKDGYIDQPRSIGLYRKLSLFFIALTVLLLGSIFYFYVVSLTVEVTPKKERKSDKTSFVVVNQDNKDVLSSNKEAIEGAVEQIPIKEEGTFQATGAKVLGREITGKAIIYNNKNDKQILIATTRLMSPEGKVYRIKDRVEIPPNGKAEVGIYTDEPSEEMAIGPTRFTLPALWSGLQDKVYAESKEAFVYNTQVEKYIQQIDIDKGLQDLKASMVDKVARQFGDNYKGYDKVISEIDKNSLNVNKSNEAGDKVDQFTIELSANVNVVAFKKSHAEQLAEGKFLSKAPTDKKVLGLDQNETEYSLSNTDFKSGEAVVEISYVGFLAARKGDALVEKDKLVGLNEAQIKTYLSNTDNFSDFKISFSPPFMKKAPILVNRIKVIIKE